MSICKSIEIHDYRSFTNEIIDLEDITCIVGANESGKSNLINALYHLSPEMQNKLFKPQELRMGAKNYPLGEIILTFKIKLNNKLLGYLMSYFDYLTDSEIILEKRGVPNKFVEWDCNLSFPHTRIKDIVRIKNKKSFLQAFKSKKTKTIQEYADNGWFINNTAVDLRKKPFNNLIDNGKIEILTKDEKVKFVADLIKEEVLNNIRIFKWYYKEEDYLPEIVQIKEFLENPNRYKSVKSLFQIAGWNEDNFVDHLTNQIDSVYVNLFDNVERQINKIIRKNWSTHHNLKIALQHKGEYFTINLTEPGSITPPHYRSDGLKWFLTFLINFRAQSKSLKYYILLIDEPGLHLHPRGQKDTLEELKVLSDKFNNQIIYSTHQTFLIDKNSPENVRIIKRETDKAGILSTNPFFASKTSGVKNPKSILTDGLLREALGFNVSDISPLNEKNILVEGVFERELFHLLNKKWQIIDLNNTSIIACSGASEIVKHANLYTTNGLRVHCLYDSDSIGLNYHKKNTIVKPDQKFHIKELSKNEELETIEDLIPSEIFTKGLNRLFEKYKIDKRIIDIPRMKNLDTLLSRENKREMKHFLEDTLIDLIKVEFNIYEQDLEIFKKIIKGLLIND